MLFEGKAPDYTVADNIAGDNFDIPAAVELFVQTIDLLDLVV